MALFAIFWGFRGPPGPPLKGGFRTPVFGPVLDPILGPPPEPPLGGSGPPFGGYPPRGDPPGPPYRGFRGGTVFDPRGEGGVPKPHFFEKIVQYRPVP